MDFTPPAPPPDPPRTPERRTYWDELMSDEEGVVLKSYREAGFDVDTAGEKRHGLLMGSDAAADSADVELVRLSSGLEAGRDYVYVQESTTDDKYLTSFYNDFPANGLMAMTRPDIFTDAERDIDSSAEMGMEQLNSAEEQDHLGIDGPRLLVPLGDAGERGDFLDDAAATGAVRFVYGLSDDLTGRTASSDGCTGVESYCIGAPHRYRTNGDVLEGTEHGAAWLFGVYMQAWRRMPYAHVTDVMELGDSCAEDLGTPGPDATTGLGRIDIGCVAYGARLWARRPVERREYWDEGKGELFDDGDDESPLERAFYHAGFLRDDDRLVDRSEKAYIVDIGNHGEDILEIVYKASGLKPVEEGKDGGNFTYMETSREGIQIGDPVVYKLVPADSFLSWSHANLFTHEGDRSGVSIRPSELRAGAWMLVSAGNEGSLIPSQAIRSPTVEKEDIFRALTDTGKLRIIYGLNDDLSGRHAESNGCQYVERYCIGAPFEFSVGHLLASDSFGGSGSNPRKTALSGTSFSAPYVFATYLLAWERMPEETTIGDIFEMGDGCVEDLGDVVGPDADTGLGRLDLGCVAYEVYKANKPMPQASPASMDDEQDFMDDFAQDLFRGELGLLSLPGETDARFGVGFPGDSFNGTYRPTRGVSGGYRPGRPKGQEHFPGQLPGLGVMRLSGGEQGLYASLSGIRFSVTRGKRGDFFGGAGTGAFSFGCVRTRRAMLSSAVQIGDGELDIGGWLLRGEADCGRGRLLDSLEGREEGLWANYRVGGEDWDFHVGGWASRFGGGEVELAGRRFDIGPGGEIEHGVTAHWELRF